MNLLSLLPGVLKAVGKVLGLGGLSEAADALTTGQLSPEKQAELQQALRDYELQAQQLNVEELKAFMSEALAEIQSEDKYVRRARPTGLYAFYAVSTALAVGLLLGAHVDSAAILAILTPLGGVGGTYVWSRTKEKLAGNGGSSRDG